MALTEEAVIVLFLDGVPTRDLAKEAGLSQRRIQQIVASQREPAAASPSDELLDAMIIEQRWQLGHTYGVPMMEGALRAAHPGYTFPRQSISDALERLYPEEFEARRHWATLKLQRGVYYAASTFTSLHLDYDGKFQEYGLYVGALLLPASWRSGDSS